MIKYSHRASRNALLAGLKMLVLNCLLALGTGCSEPQTPEQVFETNLANNRWVRPRLSTDKQNSPCVAALASLSFCEELLSVDESQSKIQSLNKTRSSLSDHQLALLHLVKGGDSALVSSLLHKALDKSGQPQAIWTDISAANLEEMSRNGNWRLLETAIVATDIAIDLDPDYSRAHFNRALALESLQLVDAARPEWSKVIELSGEKSPWTKEAQGRLSELSQELGHGASSIDSSAIAQITVKNIAQFSDRQLDGMNRFFFAKRRTS